MSASRALNRCKYKRVCHLDLKVIANSLASKALKTCTYKQILHLGHQIITHMVTFRALNMFASRTLKRYEYRRILHLEQQIIGETGTARHWAEGGPGDFKCISDFRGSSAEANQASAEAKCCQEDHRWVYAFGLPDLLTAPSCHPSLASISMPVSHVCYLVTIFLPFC